MSDRDEFAAQAEDLVQQVARGVAADIVGPLHTAYVRGRLAGEAEGRDAKRRIAAALDALRQWGEELSPHQVRALRRALEGAP